MKNKKSKSAMDMLNEFFPDNAELDKNLAIGYEQAMKGEGISSDELKKRLAEKRYSHNSVWSKKKKSVSKE